jgi:hypothetical protein
MSKVLGGDGMKKQIANYMTKDFISNAAVS